MSIHHSNFKKLHAIIPDIENIPSFAKSLSEGFMDLNFDRLEKTDTGYLIALSHLYKHPSGDLIPDPDMTLLVNTVDKTVMALTYQDTYRYDDVNATGAQNQKLAKQLDEFLSVWLSNLHQQGHRVTNA